MKNNVYIAGGPVCVGGPKDGLRFSFHDGREEFKCAELISALSIENHLAIEECNVREVKYVLYRFPGTRLKVWAYNNMHPDNILFKLIESYGAK